MTLPLKVVSLLLWEPYDPTQACLVSNLLVPQPSYLAILTFAMFSTDISTHPYRRHL